MTKRSLTLIFFLLVLVGALAGLAFLQSYLNSESFKSTILREAERLFGGELEIEELQVSLWSGFSLQGIRLRNPPGFPEDLVRAEALVLEYRLLPLLWGSVLIEELRLTGPQFRLVQNRQGQWNVEALGKEDARPEEPDEESSSQGLRVDVSRLVVRDGSLLMLGADQQELVRAQGLRMESSLKTGPEGWEGEGEVRLDSLSLSGKVELQRLHSPLRFHPGEMTMNPITASLAEGNLSGEVTLRREPRFSYDARFRLEEARVERLLEQTQTGRHLSGSLRLEGRFQGQGGLESLQGEGKAEVEGGRLEGLRSQNLLSRLLQIPDLEQIDFEEALVEYRLERGVLHTSPLRLVSTQLSLQGEGRYRIRERLLDYDLDLILARRLAQSVPRRLALLLEEREGERYGLQFHLSGSPDAPQTDIERRLLGNLGKKILGEGLKLPWQ